MIKEIVRDPLMLSRVSEKAGKGDAQIITDLEDTLRANSDRCVGMAANMIGCTKTILSAVIDGDIITMVNPVITDHSKQKYTAEEGCLSLEGTRPAERWRSVKVEYLDRKFKKKSRVFTDFSAQIIQHEIDHFDGKII
ncbi:MAG: peptide deformylase [Huintestinicola sp.]